jgi:HAD superfamily hydrolase (TIGR01509 family)
MRRRHSAGNSTKHKFICIRPAGRANQAAEVCVVRKSIQAVIFDCDGVLVDSEILGIEVEHRALAEVGLHYDVAEYHRRFLGLPQRDYIAELDADARAITGRPLPSDFSATITARLRESFEAKLAPIAGAIEFISALQMPKAVASSSLLRSLHWKLEKTGLKPAFGDHLYSAEHVKNGKPAPDLFLHAAERMGATPATTLVIEDSANGIKGAKAAGMIAAGFTAGAHCLPDHGAMLSAAGAELLFDSYGALATFMSTAR